MLREEQTSMTYQAFDNTGGTADVLWPNTMLCSWTWELQLHPLVRGLLEKYPTFGREKETGLLGALDT